MICHSDRELLSMLGQDCKRVRESISLTQKEVAELWGVTQSAVSAFERGVVDSFLWLCRYMDLIHKELDENEYKQFLDKIDGRSTDGEL